MTDDRIGRSKFVLDSLEVVNFRKFARYQLQLDSGLTVLVGDNAAGKSTLLDACAIAASSLLVKIENASSKAIETFDVRVNVTRQGSSFDRQLQFPCSVKATGSFGGESLAWSRSRNTPKKSSMTSAAARSIIDKGMAMQVKVSEGDSGTVLPLVAYYGTSRLWSTTPKTLSESRSSFTSSRTKGYIGSMASSVNERDMYAWFRKMTLWELQHRKSSPELEAVTEAVARCLHGVQQSEYSELAFDLERDELVVARSEAEGRVLESLHSMSDGYRNTLSLVADIAYRMATLNPALLDHVLETPGIIMIDEVDLHLHPLWQARILRDLRSTFPNVQFIVTTHAPVVVASVSRRHLRILGDSEAYCVAEETYGRDANAVLRIMGSGSRPSEIKELFDEFYRALEGELYEKANSILNQIEGKIGSDDTELVGARTALSLEWE